MTDAPAIEVKDLKKSFGEVVALDGLDLEVRPGTIYGLLGPNGAGKTTLVRILATLLPPTAVRRLIGLAGQFAAVDAELTGRENLEMVARLYRCSRPEARRRATELLERFGLIDAADRRASTYSGGMRRRLDLSAGLIGRPPVVLLDEPTTGLDPRSRQELWGMVAALGREGTTVLMTTQYLDEADRLAARIAVVDHGRIAAEGTPSELKAAIGGNALSVRVADPARVQEAVRELAPLSAGDQPQIDPVAGEIRIGVSDPAISAEALRRLDSRGIATAQIELQQPSLDDVFMALTGRPAEVEETHEESERRAA
jgi:ABC-2 type transport system ATP-binding protein